MLPKQADIDIILKVIQRKVLRGTHLPVTVKEIQPGNITSPYFKDKYLYLAQNKLPSTKPAIPEVETLAERFILLDPLLFKSYYYPRKGNNFVGYTRELYRQNYYTISCKSVCRTPRCYENLPYNQ